jgi:hypothetical protein
MFGLLAQSHRVFPQVTGFATVASLLSIEEA